MASPSSVTLDQGSDFTSALSVTKNPITYNPSNNSLPDAIIFIFGVMMTCIIFIAFIRIGYALFKRASGTPAQVALSKKIFTAQIIGLLGSLLLIPTAILINRDLIQVDLTILKPTPSSQGISTPPQTNTSVGSGGGSASCASPQVVAASLTKPGGVCAGTVCKALVGCKYQPYESLIRSKAQEAGVSASLVISIMCRESKAIPNQQHKNDNGTYDCGLMQINQPTPCTAESYEPATNISQGIALIKNKLQATSGKVYPNMPTVLQAIASYNCCGGGTIPTAPSTDCTAASGFPFTPPKWACPINPGESKTNMCFVKNYVCDVSTCMEDLDSM